MTAPLDLDDLRQSLLDKLRAVLHVHEPEADSNKDSFIVDADKYVLKATISEAEVSYTFELKQPVNGLRLGIFSIADYAPFIGDPDLEKAALSVYHELMNLIDTIHNREIYVGKQSSKGAYIAWQDIDKYKLKLCKKTFFGGLMSTESSVDKEELQKLNLERI